MSRALCSLLLSALLSFSTDPAAAQDGYTGRLNFKVADADGVALPGVNIEVKGAVIEGQRNVVTDAAGTAGVVALPPGAYTASATLDGFKPFTRAVQLRLGGKLQINITLSRQEQ